MSKKIILLTFFILAFGSPAFAQEKTVINDGTAGKILLGKHLLSLQWISWDYFGSATVINKKGVLYLQGNQKGRGESATDYVKVDGVITEINAKDFKFEGVIETQISHINGGAPCKREGTMTFLITGKRKYWRLQEMDNPCEGVTDYVDIYFR